MASYDKNSVKKHRNNSYFGVRVTKDDICGSSMKEINENLEGKSSGVKVGGNDFIFSPDDVKIDNLVKIRTGNSMGNYNKNVYRVYDIIETEPEEAPETSPDGRGYKNLILEPFDKRGDNVRVVAITSSELKKSSRYSGSSWFSKDSYRCSDDIGTYTKNLRKKENLMSEVKIEERKGKSNWSVRLNSLKILSDNLTYDIFGINEQKVLPHII